MLLKILNELNDLHVCLFEGQFSHAEVKVSGASKRKLGRKKPFKPSQSQQLSLLRVAHHEICDLAFKVSFTHEFLPDPGLFAPRGHYICWHVRAVSSRPISLHPFENSGLEHIPTKLAFKPNKHLVNYCHSLFLIIRGQIYEYESYLIIIIKHYLHAHSPSTLNIFTTLTDG